MELYTELPVYEYEIPSTTAVVLDELDTSMTIDYIAAAKEKDLNLDRRLTGWRSPLPLL
jgi:hypothetical protein